MECPLFQKFLNFRFMELEYIYLRIRVSVRDSIKASFRVSVKVSVSVSKRLVYGIGIHLFKS